MTTPDPHAAQAVIARFLIEEFGTMEDTWAQGLGSADDLIAVLRDCGFAVAFVPNGTAAVVSVGVDGTTTVAPVEAAEMLDTADRCPEWAWREVAVPVRDPQEPGDG
jgi:hypothetical protein